MADGCGEDENAYFFPNYTRKKNRRTTENTEDVEESPVEPDLGLGTEHTFEKKSSETTGSGHSNGLPRREENPFSFKHFLKRDSGNNYHITGARPKVYSSVSSESFGQSSLDPIDSDPSLYSRSTTPRHVATSELASVLPDFVQDHLVVEQCFLNHTDVSKPPHISVDLDNLPDFAINSDSSSYTSTRSKQWDETKNNRSETSTSDIPFDLTDSTSNHVSTRRGNSTTSATIPLDLPSFDRSPVDEQRRSPIPGGGLPFDLPLVSEIKDGNSATISGVRSGPQLNEVGVSKSLPDFLSDGPIHSDLHDSLPINEDEHSMINGVASPTVTEQSHRLISENERLRRELDATRRQLADQTRRPGRKICSNAYGLTKHILYIKVRRLIQSVFLAHTFIDTFFPLLRVQSLEKDLHTLQSKEHEETASLEKAIEQVEDNLKRSTSELSTLRRESSELRLGQASGASASNHSLDDRQSQNIAQELRTAASTAEHSLRQLLTGVGNLRIIASTLENMHRIQDRTEDFMVNFDDDSGPAL
uniref:Endosome-associated-trafficking regulator 1 n=1 Tax=Timema douglasi TaxID=61478 RepID=A0A7R8V9Y2_TIMDO|nr:unnamed protein product [Timema douglasi]